VLWQYDVLDTVPEEVFDDLTETGRPHLRSADRLDLPGGRKTVSGSNPKVGLTTTETVARCSRFCARAIQQEGLFIIPDGHQDRRFRP